MGWVPWRNIQARRSGNGKNDVYSTITQGTIWQEYWEKCPGSSKQANAENANLGRIFRECHLQLSQCVMWCLGPRGKGLLKVAYQVSRHTRVGSAEWWSWNRSLSLLLPFHRWKSDAQRWEGTSPTVVVIHLAAKLTFKQRYILVRLRHVLGWKRTSDLLRLRLS